MYLRLFVNSWGGICKILLQFYEKGSFYRLFVNSWGGIC